MCEHGCRASHNEGHDDPNIRPKQLRNREVPWEGSHRSKLMSRRTERPYKVDGAGELARHSAARCSAPEINGPVVQQEFTFLLRETCGPSLSATAGTVVSNDQRAGQESAEAVVPRATSRQHRNRTDSQLGKGRTWQADTTIGGLVSEAMKPIGRATDSDHRGRERVLLLSARTVRNRRTRTRMYGGVGGGRGNPPADPIRHRHRALPRQATKMASVATAKSK